MTGTVTASGSALDQTTSRSACCCHGGGTCWSGGGGDFRVRTTRATEVTN
ncbi:hypothetical protein [Haloarchaeobius sp. DFWS5]